MAKKWSITGILIATIIGFLLGIDGPWPPLTFSLGILYGGYVIPWSVYRDSSTK